MITILYRPESEHARGVEEFKTELVRQQGVVKLVNIDSKEGTTIARLYDITKYPAVIVHHEDGQAIEQWSGKLPTINDTIFASHK